MSLQTPLQIVFRNTDSSEAIEERVRERVTRLEGRFDRITACRVVVEIPHRSPGSGKNAIALKIEVEVPGKLLVAHAEEPAREMKGDQMRVVADAFNALERQLDDYVRLLRRDIKDHGVEVPQTGRIARLFPEQDYGFVETAAGGDLYFTRNAVARDGFDDLEVGMTVALTVAPEEGPMGPQAESIRRVAEGERFV